MKIVEGAETSSMPVLTKPLLLISKRPVIAAIFFAWYLQVCKLYCNKNTVL